MKAKRTVTAASALVVSLVLASVAEAGIFGRARDAVQILISEGQARRGWVIFDPVPVDGGDVEVLGISVLSHDPAHPAFLIRFQATDVGDVMAAIRTGNEITVRKYQLIREQGRLPTYLVESRKDRGWRTAKVPRASPFFAQWAYLISCRALSGYPDQLDSYFDRRPDLRTLCERDVAQMYKAVYDEIPTAPAESPATREPTEVCDESGFLTPESCAAEYSDYIGRIETSVSRAASILDQLLTMDSHVHHGERHVHVDDVESKARRALELLEGVLEP